MKIRLVLGFAILVFLALFGPGPAFGGGLETAYAQATSSAPTVLAVVRNQGATLHNRPGGEQIQTLVGGSLLMARLRSQDDLWVLVETRDKTVGWVEVRSLLAAGLSRLPVEEPTPTSTQTPSQTPTPGPTTEPDSTAMPQAAETGAAEPTQEEMTPMPPVTATATDAMEPTAQPTDVATPTPTAPEPTATASPEPTPSEVTPVPILTPFEPPAGPRALTLVQLGGAALWRGEDGAFVAQFKAGRRLTAAYRTADSSWYFVYNNAGVHGWASAAELVVIDGSSLPVEEFTILAERNVSTSAENAATETPIPTPTATATSTTVAPPPKIVITVDTLGQRLNVRAGPGTQYDVVTKAVTGVTFNAIGRDEGTDWIQVAIADLPSGFGWVSAAYVTAEGPLERLPVVEGRR